jgi:hypothetical protein
MNDSTTFRWPLLLFPLSCIHIYFLNLNQKFKNKNVHMFMGYYVMFQYMCTLCNVQTRVSISFSSNIYHYFMVKTFKILSSNFLKYIVSLL